MLASVRNLFIHSRNRNCYTRNMQPHSQSNLYRVEEPHSLLAAVQYLKDGDVIALPTDTVYGLACDANNEKSIRNLYNIKGRDFEKPVAICVKDLKAFRKYAKSQHLNDALILSLLPGPITIVVERSEQLRNPFLNPTTTKIGIRIPDCPFIQQICALNNAHPLALTSANRSAERSCLNVQEFKELWPLLGGVFDSGSIGLSEERRLASTVIDLSQPGFYRILREGIALKSTLNLLRQHGLQCFGNK